MKKISLPWIVGGLAIVALAGFLFFPNLLVGTPFLLLLFVCPLMMFFMMGGMQHGQRQGNQQHADHNLSQPTLPTSSSSWSGLNREEQIAELKARLSHLEAQPADLSNIDGDKSMTQGPIIVEAEAIARTADSTGHRHI